MEKGYNEIIELDSLDEFIQWNNTLVIIILLMLVKSFNSDEKLLKSYRFNVISYGFQGYYPVIGVEYLEDNLTSIEELVLMKYKTLVKTTTLDNLLDFSISNKDSIQKIINEITNSPTRS